MRRFKTSLREQFPDEDDSFDQFEEMIQAWEDRFRRAERNARTEDEAALRFGVTSARRLIAVHSTNLAARVTNLGNGLVALFNAANAHSAPAVARALYETCAVSAYMRRHLVPLLENNRAARVKVMLFRLGLGSDPGTGWGRLRPYKVKSYVKAMALEADDLAAKADEPPEQDADARSWEESMRLFYSDLSEHTHPNWAATTLSMELGPRLRPSWTLQPRITESTLHGPLGTAYLALFFGGQAWDAVLDASAAHPVVLPRSEEFGRDDLHWANEAPPS